MAKNTSTVIPLAIIAGIVITFVVGGFYTCYKPFFKNVGSYVDTSASRDFVATFTFTGYEVRIYTTWYGGGNIGVGKVPSTAELQERIGNVTSLMNSTVAGNNIVIVRCVIGEAAVGIEGGTEVFVILIYCPAVDMGTGDTSASSWYAGILPVEEYRVEIEFLIAQLIMLQIPFATNV